MATVDDLKGVLGLLKEIATFLFTGIGDVLNIVKAEPLLLIPFGVIMARTIISIFRRMFNY